MPWDLLIAQRLHGGRDRDAFARHLAFGRLWANQLLQDSGLDEAELVAELHRPDASLARVLDEYCYLRYTAQSPERSRTARTRAELSSSP
jgi:hypothetical protein